MTDTATATGEMPTERAAEIEIAPSGVADAPGAPADARALPELEYPVGPLRQSVLDALLDADEPLSVSRILAEMPPGTSRNSAESAIKREFDAGRIERVAPGVYRLAPAKPPEAPKPAAPPPLSPVEEETWLDALAAWIDAPETWDRERFGPRPDEPGRRIPASVVAKGVDRSRKRQERRKDADAAAAKRAAADAELRNQLIAAAGGNVVRGPAIDDVSAIRLALELVPIDLVCRVISWKVNRLFYPANLTLTSWRDRPLLKAIALEFCKSIIIPKSVDAWAAAGTAQGKAVERAEAQPPPEPESAPAVPPAMPDAMPDAMLDDDWEAEPAKHGEPVPVGRDAVLAGFARNRTPPPPAPPERQAEQAEPERMSDEGWGELIAGFMAGTVNWNVRRLGPEPGRPNCRAPRHILRGFGL